MYIIFVLIKPCILSIRFRIYIVVFVLIMFYSHMTVVSVHPLCPIHRCITYFAFILADLCVE